MVCAGLLLAGGASAKKAKPESITCEMFLAYDPNVQERIVWWMEGWDAAGDGAPPGRRRVVAPGPGGG